MTPADPTNDPLARELTDLLSGTYPDIEVEVSLASRWDRPCVTFRTEAFVGLLPEERFQRLLQVLPRAVLEQRLAGFVWLELEPGQSVADFLAEPRSEDVAEAESDVYRELLRVGFFDALREALGPDPEKPCRGDFQQAMRILHERRVPPPVRRDAKLVCIRQGVYCDCQILRTVEPELAARYCG